MKTNEYRPKPLSKSERIKLIEEVIARYKELSNLSDTLNDLFGATADCKVLDPVWGAHDSYSEAVSKLIGDDFDWLGWYIYENDCGEKGMAAKASSWKKNRPIKTVKDLEKIISADYEND